MAGTYSPAERQYYDQLFDSVDKDQTGMLAGQDALPLMTKSNLPQQTLGEIWALSDPDNNGFLTKESWYRAARIIGWLQKGGKSVVEESLLSSAGPYPTFNGLPGPPSRAPISAQTTGQRPLAANSTGSSLPPLTAADRTKFTRIFVGCGPHNGLVAGDKARDVFVKSQLSYDKLGLIWNLADTQQRGSLDLPDFIIGMFLIQTCMANPNVQLPATLPPGMYEQASGGRAPPNAPSSPIVRQNTGPQSPVRPQYTGGTIQPQRTGQGSQMQAQSSPSRQGTMSNMPSGQAGSGFTSSTMGSAFSQNRGNQPWDVTSEAKATSDRFFAQLDQQNRGTIEGDVAVPFMLQSQLDEGTLATIWDLSDIKHEGKLDREMFAVAMHLINNKLAGKDLPASLPNSLVPPSLRQEFGGGQQEVLDNGPSNATKDLFDLFADDPPPPAAQQAAPSAFGQTQNQSQPFSAGGFSAQPLQAQGTGQGVPSRQLSPAPTGNRFVPQSSFGLAATNTAPAARSPPPPSDLLGEDAADTTPDVPDNSAEIGNKKNQLENTQRGLSALESTRATLEKSDKSNSSQLQELETSLATARSRHEEESKIVADLRSRVSDQQEKMKNLNMDTIAAESDLSAMRSERDELEQALLRDKEEIRGLQKKMREADEEKTTLKNLLEKLKKETRQQKGMVTIAKKQLSTSEGNRDNAQKDLDDFHKNAQDDEEEEESRGRGLGGGASAGLGALGGAALGAGAASAFGQQRERSASPFGQAQSPVGQEGAAGIALPATPQALSPVATGASNRSNNPFDRLRTQSRGPAPPVPQAQSPPSASTPTFERSASPVTRDVEAPQEEPRSPGGTATGILAGAGTAVGLAAGVAVAGASAVFGAAKEAIAGEHSDEEEKKDVSEKAVVDKDEDKTPTAEESDPFGAPSHSSPVAGGQETDVFGAVTGPTQSGFSESAGSDSDPFGAPTSTEPVSKDLETDAFGASSPAQPDFSAPPAADTDPFGASTQTSFDDFDNGFGDSFATAPTAGTEAEAPTGNADFDSAFDEFDDAPATSTESQVPETAGQMTASPERDTMSPGLPVGIPKSALTAVQSGSGLERTDSTQAVAPASPKVMPATGETTPAEPTAARSVTVEPTEELLSSDEEEGPEDLDAPKRGYNSTTQVQDDDDVPLASLKSAAAAAPPLASPVDAPKGRRSAPPPPASKSSTGAAPVPIDDFDPFGAPSATAAAAAPPTTQPFDNDFGSLPPGAAPAQAQTTGPQTSKFDDDDFDFSDMPPARVDETEPSATTTKNTSAFDDEFAGFDDEFESVPTNPNSGSDRSNLSKSFEMVSPSQGQPQKAQQSTGNTDEWGQPAGQQLQRPVPPASGFSFDDAFGGDFEPAPPAAQQTSQATSYAPPPGAPPASGIQSLAKPSLPERKPSAVGTGPQPDDLEDVKKLCGMGFPRVLAVGALESNGYDFQKALNVLLSN